MKDTRLHVAYDKWVICGVCDKRVLTTKPHYQRTVDHTKTGVYHIECWPDFPDNPPELE